MKPRLMLWLCGVVALFALSCFLPAFRFDTLPDVIYGRDALLTFPYVLQYPAWYANLLLLMGVLTACFRQYRIAKIYAGMACLLAGIHLVPHLFCIGTLYVGYFCWLGSMILLWGICRYARKAE